MTIQGRASDHRPPPPPSPPRPVPHRPGAILHRAAVMALPHHAACGAPPAPPACAFSPRSRRPPLSAPPSVAAEVLRKLLVPRTMFAPPAAAAAASASAPSSSRAPAGLAFSALAPSVAAESLNTIVPRATLAPPAAPAASASAPPPSAAPAGRVFSAPAPPSLSGLHPVKASLALPALDLMAVSKQGLPIRSARRGIGTVATSICYNTSLADTNLSDIHGRSSETMALEHRGTPPVLLLHRPSACLHRPSTPMPAAHQLFSDPPEELRRLFSPNTPLAPASASEEGLPDVYLGPSSSSAPPPVGPVRCQLTVPAASVFSVPVCKQGTGGNKATVRRDFLEHVKVCFCRRTVEMPVDPEKQTIMEVVLLALKKLNIRARDFYLTLKGKMLDGGLMVNSIPALDGSSIHVVPRMRGGARSRLLSSRYYPLSKIIDAYPKRLVRYVHIHNCMRHATSDKDAPLLSSFSQYLVHYLLECVCRDGHLNDISWNGAFSLSDILLYDGHMRISPDVPVHKYSPAGGAADYRRLYDIVLIFLDLLSGKCPVHVSHLLKTLLNADESVRLKPEFVNFVVNHPCLLTYSEKQMVYSLVDRLLGKLPASVVFLVDQELGVLGWEAMITPVTAFKNTYTYVPKQQVTQTPPVPGAAVQNPSVPGAAIQNPSVPGAAVQNPSVPGTTTQNPSVPGAAVQNPSVPGATIQNPSVPGSAVPSTSTGTRRKGYGPELSQCFHLGRNFLNHPPQEANLETAEVALSYLLEFLLPEVLEALSKVLTGTDAKTFMEILSNPKADKSTVRVSVTSS